MSKNLNIKDRLTILDQDSIKFYLNELSTNKQTIPLTPDMEAQLFTEFKLATDQKIKDRIKERIVMANLRWVITIAKQFSYPKARLEDLINEGNIGLMKAVDKFDVTRGTSFLTFATWDIRQEISKYINETLSDVVQPANRYRINKLINQAESILRKKDNEYPTMEQIIEMYYKIKETTDPLLTVADYNEIKMQSKGFVSMELQLSDRDEPDLTLSNTFKSGSEYNADYSIAVEDKNYEIKKMLNVLESRTKDIVEYRFGLNGREEKTLDQISDIIGLTRERVGQLLENGLKQLRNHKGKVYELCGTSKETAHSIETNHMNFAKHTF